MGDLHQYLSEAYQGLDWKRRLAVLLDVIKGLRVIHNAGLVHQDLHTGNILLSTLDGVSYAAIGDLCLSRPADKEPDDGVYGVLPYCAPELLIGDRFSTASDMYSLGIVMWELATFRRPFSHIAHDKQLAMRICDGERPDLPKNAPLAYIELMQQCWEFEPTSRPTVEVMEATVRNWIARISTSEEGHGGDDDLLHQFEAAESARLELLRTGDGESDAKTHPKATYSSRLLEYHKSKDFFMNDVSFSGRRIARFSTRFHVRAANQ
jgi:serine/threonine protein kinase